MENEENKSILINEKSIEVLIAKFIPTSQYIESKFDHMQYQIDEIKTGVKEIKVDMNKRFEQVDKKFDSMQADMNKRFEQVDKKFDSMQADVNKRFEQVDRRFEQVNEKLDKVLERIDIKIDRGLSENRSASLKLFSFAMIFSAISMTGLLGRIANVF